MRHRATPTVNLPFRARIWAIVAATVLAALLPAGGAILLYDHMQVREALHHNIHTLAGVAGANSAAALSFEDAKSAGEILEGLRANPSIDAAVLYLPTGEPLAVYRREGAHALPTPDAEAGGSRFEAGRLRLFQSVEFRGQPIGTIYLEANLDEAAARQRRYAAIVSVVLLLSSGLAFLLSSKLQESVSGPISRLVDTAKAISANGDYSLRATKHADDELGRFIDTFNQMLSGIERRDRELSRHRATLEIEVNERTRELTESNAELVEARNRAEAASLAKMQFLANMSHEIRTPMNGVLSMTRFLLETDLTAEQREFASTVQSSSEALLAIINDILDFSKIEAGKMALDPGAFSIPELLEDTLRAIAIRAHEKGVELVGDILPEVPELVVTDPVRLRQVITNLAGNAIKFTEKGEVAVTINLASANVLLIAVRDTGPGIPVDQHRPIFDAFAQADGSTTRRHGGTGLGLAISKRLAEAMGGHIWVESTLGKGSTFYFTVAFDTAEAPPRPLLPAQLRNRRVLLVDDNATALESLAQLLRLWSFEVTEATSGADALAMAQTAPWDLIIVDAHMPGMDGYDFAERLRRLDQPSAQTPVILLNSAMHGSSRRKRSPSVTASLTKPVRRQELRAVIIRIFTGLVEVSSSESPRAQRTSPVPLHILLAEDNKVNQRVALRILESAGHQVTVAPNGTRAVERWEADRFDLVLMDVMMPELDGFEATREIRNREDASGAHTPIFAMTASAMAGDRERCLAAGMDDYISKPIDAAELLALVSRVQPEINATESR
ncbi:MAG: response regulator [Bryobacterales bacterium]|nr:response regulator [Bryobacterales bacterium]